MKYVNFMITIAKNTIKSFKIHFKNLIVATSLQILSSRDRFVAPKDLYFIDLILNETRVSCG